MKPHYPICLSIFLFLAACGGATDNNVSNNSTNNPTNNANNTVETTGQSLYEEPLAGANTFTCSTCHALTEPADDGITRPGHPIGDAFARPNYKNGQVESLLEAVNSCVVEWMAGEPFAESDEDWQKLEQFLADQAPAEAEALTFEIVEPPADVSGGDPDAGLEAFDASCSVCHGEGGGGTNKAPPVAGLELDPDYIAERIRLSGSSGSAVYDGLTGGRMPFWAPDRISDQQLIDIVAYVAGSAMVEPGNNINNPPNNDNNTNNTNNVRSCGSTSPKIGQTLTFDGQFHDVAGNAEIIDDCTIQLTNFDYDGTGIDVRIYGGIGGNYGAGFAISEDLLRSEPYQGETLTLQLPEDKTLDDLDGLSVWCVAVGQDFGSGSFE